MVVTGSSSKTYALVSSRGSFSTEVSPCPCVVCADAVAADQDDGIRGAELDVEQVAADFERVVIQRAVDDVGAEEAAEEKNFGDQEDPHAHRGGVPLLVHRFELMREPGWVGVRVVSDCVRHN